MQYSGKGLLLTEREEGCKLEAYLDSVGVPTIGYGHTRGVSLGMTCSQEQAEEWLKEDLAFAEGEVNSLVKVPLTQGEFDALVDFTFNLGGGALEHSTLLKLLNEGDFQGAAEELPKWDHAGGKVLQGLLRRRLEEKEEFLNG